MMNNESVIFFKMIRDFLTIYLPKQKGASLHTIKSYRTAINQYLNYATKKLNIPLSSFNFGYTSISLVECFLKDGEEKLDWSISTRNQKLAVIRSFYKYSSNHNIELIGYYKELNAIPVKSDIKNKQISIFSESDLEIILKQPDIRNNKEFRNLIIMILLYDTACRVQELLDLTIGALQLNDKTPYALLKGKGNKERIVPLMEKTVDQIKKYIKIFHGNSYFGEDYLFFTVHNGLRTKMSQDNVQRIIDKYCDLACKIDSNIPKHIHCHMFRHSRATHLYRNGMPLALISEWLGHSQLGTTRDYYASADIEMKRKAINIATSSLNPLNNQVLSYEYNYTDDELVRKLYGLT